MNPILGNGGFHHVCIKTREWDRTMAFYQETLGCNVKIAWRASPQRAVMLDTGDGNYLEVFEDLASLPTPGGAVIHFAKITMEPKDVTIATTNEAGAVPIRIFFCEGPSGEVIEFFQNSLT